MIMVHSTRIKTVSFSQRTQVCNSSQKEGLLLELELGGIHCSEKK